MNTLKIPPFDPNKNIDGEDYSKCNNGTRAERAAEALEAYRQGDAPDESHYRDLICDLCHLMHREGEDIASQLQMGFACFIEENDHEQVNLPYELTINER